MNYRKSSLHALATGLCVLTLSGCVSQGLPQHLSSMFRTRITPTGLKHFEVRVVPKKYQSAVENGDIITQEKQPTYYENGERKRVNSDRLAKKSEKLLEREVNELIAETQYCREGYWVVDANYYGSLPYVRGECNELASTEDREQFPDTITYW